MQSAWNHCAPGGGNYLQIAGGLFSALCLGRQILGTVFCRPLKRALGGWGIRDPQSDDWGYHLTPAEAGFNAGLPDIWPFSAARNANIGIDSMGLATARRLELIKIRFLGVGASHWERDLNHGFGALSDVSAKKEDCEKDGSHAPRVDGAGKGQRAARGRYGRRPQEDY
jgi:hypothetical protein